MIPPGTVRLFERPFYFLRHGQSRLNAEKRIAGSIDTELTELGHVQARTAADAIAAHRITAIYASPMQRARHTADHVAARIALPVVLIDEIAERRWGTLEGELRSMREPGMVPDGAESFEAFVDRAMQGLRRIDAEAPLLVAHSGIYRVLCHVLDIPKAEAPVGNALPVRFEAAGERWRIAPLLP